MKTLFSLLLITTLLWPGALKAQHPVAEVIKQHSIKLNYPRSVKHFYEQEAYRLVWILPDTMKTPVWDGMQLLDCVLQYGLTPADYLPQVFTYNNLHTIQTGKVSDIEKAEFDVQFTDVMLTLINNLHYGKLNPQFPAGKIDADDITQFRACKVLIDALEINNLMPAILSVQPRSEAYVNLQRHISIFTTKYSGSNYVKPEKEIRKMAINMERLRWINTTGKKMHLTCIVKNGDLIYYKDIDKQDEKLGRSLYNETTTRNFLHNEN